MNTKIGKLIISLILMLSILVIINYKKTRYEKKETDILDTIGDRLEDFGGRIVDKSLLNDKIVYLQYVNAFNNSDMELFDSVCENWSDNRIVIIGFFEENTRFKQMKGKYNSFANVFFVVNRDRFMNENLLLSKVINKYFIFDKNGTLSFSNNSFIGYDNGVKSKLKKILNNDSFNINEFLPINLNVSEVIWLNQIVEVVKGNNANFHIFALMNEICESCGSGLVIRLLKTFNKNQDFSVNLIIGNASFEYSDTDITALRSQGHIEFPVINADKNLSEKWNHYIYEPTFRT